MHEKINNEELSFFCYEIRTNKCRSCKPYPHVAYNISKQPNNKRFKYKENAEKWIEDNKPKYSKKDIERAFEATKKEALATNHLKISNVFWRTLNDK